MNILFVVPVIIRNIIFSRKLGVFCLIMHISQSWKVLKNMVFGSAYFKYICWVSAKSIKYSCMQFILGKFKCRLQLLDCIQMYLFPKLPEIDTNIKFSSSTIWGVSFSQYFYYFLVYSRYDAIFFDSQKKTM